MKVLVVSFLVIIIWVQAQTVSTDLYLQSAIEAAKHLKKLKSKSPTFHGFSLRKYVIKDLNFDGIFEVLEYVSEVEEEMTGYLTVSSSLPTYWINIYSMHNGKFQESTKDFRKFLKKQKLFYQFWYECFKSNHSEDKTVINAIEKNLERVAQFLKYGFYLPGNAPTSFY